MQWDAQKVKAASQAGRNMLGELQALIHCVALEKSLNLSGLLFSHFKTKINISYSYYNNFM